VTKRQLDVRNFCEIMQKFKFTGVSNKCQRRVRLSDTGQAKFSATMKRFEHIKLPAKLFDISYEVIKATSINFSFGGKEMLKVTVFQHLQSRDLVVLTQEPQDPPSPSTCKALSVEESDTGSVIDNSARYIVDRTYIMPKGNGSSWRWSVYLQTGEPTQVKNSQFSQHIQMTVSYALR